MVLEDISEEEKESRWIQVASKRKNVCSTVIRAASNLQPTIDVGLIDQDGKRGPREGGSGKITIDSSAGESVCPIDMAPEESLHKTEKIGTRYRAAGGGLINKGAKRIKFKPGQKIGKLNF